MPGVLMHSGAVATVENPVVPISDIARGLAAMPRFAGQTRRWWTVAHHSLWAASFARARGEETALQLALLMHDAHEAFTGDVPTPFKTFDLRRQQKEIDSTLMDAYFPGGYAAYRTLGPLVKEYDRGALHAEASVVGPPVLSGLKSVALFNEHFWHQPRAEAVVFLTHWLDANGRLLDPGGLGLELHPAAVVFLQRYASLFHECLEEAR